MILITGNSQMKKKSLFIVIGGISLLIIVACLFFYTKIRSLNQKLGQTELMMQKLQTDTKRLEEDKLKILKENEQLQADAISYVGINTQLQSEKSTLQQGLDESKKILEQKEEELQKAKVYLRRYEEKMAKDRKENKVILEGELGQLKENVKNLEQTLNKERGIYHYNLAVSFTQAELYDDAIEAYEKSLQFNPENADAYYNLGLLYANIRNNPEKAIQEYRAYLKLKPDAPDRDEVEAWIRQLGAIYGAPSEGR